MKVGLFSFKHNSFDFSIVGDLCFFWIQKKHGTHMTFAVSIMVRLKLLYCSVLSSSRSQGQDINLCAVKWSRLCLQCVPSCQETKTTVKVFDRNLFYDHCSYGSDHPLYFHVKIILAGKEFYMVFVLDCMSFSDVCIMDMDEVIMSSVH